MSYNKEELIEPFWAEYSSEASGRDPLAIQNSSVVIYTKMVVGITNVTNRIRYYGFYCWLFDTILLNISKTNSEKEQVRYLRRAELLLAYMMVREFPNITGVSGSFFAARNIDSNFSLIAGADWESFQEGGPGLYWKARHGVFGQYYSGVVRELNLINHPNPQIDLNIYTVTTKGQELAKAYSKNIPAKERELFWKCVFTGTFHTEDLAALKAFALHLIPEDSDERTFYETMLLSQDDKKLEPTFNRRNTIKLLLDLLQKYPEGIENLPTSFLRENYTNHIVLKELTLNTASAWYLFELNELIHVAFEHFHVSFLYSIKTYPTLLDECINSLLNETVKALKDNKINANTTNIETLLKFLAKQKVDIYNYYDAMEQAFRSDDFGVCIKNAMQTILSAYLNSKHHLSALTVFASMPEYNFNRSGYAIELLDDLVESKRELSIKEYIKSILLNAINLHTFSSYSKTRIGQSLVHNYMIENDSVWRLRQTLPNRTTPRLQNAIQYMVDIGWIARDDKKYVITDSGINIS